MLVSENIYMFKIGTDMRTLYVMEMNCAPISITAQSFKLHVHVMGVSTGLL